MSLLKFKDEELLPISSLLQQNLIYGKSSKIFLREIAFKKSQNLSCFRWLQHQFLCADLRKQTLLGISEIEPCHDNVAKDSKFVVFVRSNQV